MSDPCATCSRCCRSYIVSVCGYDIWQIYTRERLSPEHFLVACPQDEPRRDGFLLEATGPTFGLMLDKQGPLRAKRPCVFLLRLAGGFDRCGIYSHRPVVCQAYPMALLRGETVQRDNVLCPPDSWPPDQVRRPAWRAALQRQRMHFDIYRQVVLRWNARVAAHPAHVFRLAEYFSYVLNVYDRLAGLDSELEPDELSRVQDSWGALPGSAVLQEAGGHGQRQIDVDSAACPWLDYALHAKSIIDRYFPEVEAQPLRLPLAADEAGPTHSEVAALPAHSRK